jgi:hypothetical protein
MTKTVSDASVALLPPLDPTINIRKLTILSAREQNAYSEHVHSQRCCFRLLYTMPPIRHRIISKRSYNMISYYIN